MQQPKIIAAIESTPCIFTKINIDKTYLLLVLFFQGLLRAFGVVVVLWKPLRLVFLVLDIFIIEVFAVILTLLRIIYLTLYPSFSEVELSFSTIQQPIRSLRRNRYYLLSYCWITFE